MSDPGSSLMYASMGISSIGSIANTFEQIASTRAQSEYESTIARTNAAIAGYQGKQALEAGDFAAGRKDLETRAVVGSMRATQGASGTDVGSGSNALVRLAAENAGAMDQLTIRNNAARTAFGFQTEAIQETYKGQFATLAASAKTQQSILNGGLSAIEGPLAMESNYLRWSRYMGGGGSSSGSRMPFDLGTN